MKPIFLVLGLLLLSVPTTAQNYVGEWDVSIPVDGWYLGNLSIAPEQADGKAYYALTYKDLTTDEAVVFSAGLWEIRDIYPLPDYVMPRDIQRNSGIVRPNFCIAQNIEGTSEFRPWICSPVFMTEREPGNFMWAFYDLFTAFTIHPDPRQRVKRDSVRE